MNLLARNVEIIQEIVEIGIMIRWVIYEKKKRYATTANEISLYTYPKTRKLHRIPKKSKL